MSEYALLSSRGGSKFVAILVGGHELCTLVPERFLHFSYEFKYTRKMYSNLSVWQQKGAG